MTVKDGDKVKVLFVVRDEDGKVVDATDKDKPMEFVLGANQVIPGLEQGVHGLKPGQTVEFDVAPDDAFGEWKQDFVKKLPSQQIAHLKLKMGMEVEAKLPSGTRLRGRVVKIEPEFILVDLNHPLAGRHLKFRLHLVSSEPSA